MHRASLVVIAIAAVGCKDQRPDRDACACTPGNRSTTKAIGEAAPMDGVALVGALRRHHRLVADHTNPRAVKLFDDGLRLAIIDFCQPCSDWVKDRLTIEEMFPLDQLDRAARGVCMGLVLHDGTTAFGDARPRACR